MALPDIPNLKSEISDSAPLCPGCGYDLRGQSGNRCPECGLVVDESAGYLSVTLPWAHRRTIGRTRAYVRTVLLAAFRPRRLAMNVAGPVSYADAVAFRRVTVAVAVVPVGVLLTVLAFWPDNDFLVYAFHHPVTWWAELLTVVVAWAGLWLATLAAAGVAGYWFHPRSIPVEQQNRAVALSLYGCGPLALLPVACACGAGCAAAGLGTTNHQLWDTIGESFGIALAAVVLFVAIDWWWSTIGLLRHTTHCGFARQLSLAVGLPIAWAVLAGVFAVGLPVAVLWLMLVVKSLA